MHIYQNGTVDSSSCCLDYLHPFIATPFTSPLTFLALRFPSIRSYAVGTWSHLAKRIQLNDRTTLADIFTAWCVSEIAIVNVKKLMGGIVKF